MNINTNQQQNPMNYANNNQTNKTNIKDNYLFYQSNNNKPINKNNSNELYSYDKRLVLSLKYLGLSKYIPNFIKRGIRFEDFLSFSNSDLTSLKIPSNIQDIIQKFILSYLNFGSMYNLEEIVQFFKNRKAKKYFPKSNELNINERNRDNRNNAKYKSVNQRDNINNNYNRYLNLNDYNNNQINLNINKYGNEKRPKSQNSKFISDPNYLMKKNKTPNNMNKKILRNDNINTMKINNFRVPSKKGNDKKLKRNIIQNNMYDITTNSNSNVSSLQSNQNNINIYSPYIDNFSHMAMNESPQLLNIMKMAKNKNVNVINLNHLKKNLGKNFLKARKAKINNNGNTNNRNNKLIDDNRNENAGLNRSTSKDIINRMNEVLKRYELKKKSTNSSINLNMNNKGYHSDGYLKEKNNIYNNDFMDIEGYELNTYYAGDTSKFSSIGGNNNYLSEVRKTKKTGNGYNSKTTKSKKINEEQARKVEYLLSHGSNSRLKNMNNFDTYDEDEISLITGSKSKTNMSNFTSLTNNMNQHLLSKKNNYINQANIIRQKNLLIQKKDYKNKITKNKPNNFNTYASNRGNIPPNYNKYNNFDENKRINNNMVNIPNQKNRPHKKEGPVQIAVKNKKRIKNNNYINLSPNHDNNIKERGKNYFNVSNNSLSNFSMGNQYRNEHNIMKYPLNNYLNAFISINNKEPKRNIKSFDKQMKNRVYAGIHNINNNINNININNINYDGKKLAGGFNNLVDLDMKMNYHRTQDNFFDPNNLLNNNEILNDFY